MDKRMERRLLLATLAAIVVLVVSAGCAELDRSSGSPVAEVTTVSADELHAMLETKDFLLVNVHVPYEGEIPGTDVHIPFDQVEDFAEMLPEDKNAKIVQYCRSAGMTKTSGETLLRMGYSNVYELEGGFIAWKSAGYELLHLR